MKIGWKTCFRIGCSVFVLYLAMRWWPSIAHFFGILLGGAMPIFIGCAIAYLVNILMRFYERHWFVRNKKTMVLKTRRPVCMTLAFLTLIGIVALVVGLVVPELVSCVELIVEDVSSLLEKAVVWLEKPDMLPENALASLHNVDWKTLLQRTGSALFSGLGGIMEGAFSLVTSVVSGVVTAFLSIIFAIYLLAGKERLGRQIRKAARRYVKPGLRKKLGHVVSVVDDSFHRYFVGQCIEAVILGTLCTLGMLLLRLPYASMIGALIAFTALIPVAGAYIGGMLGAFMILTVSPMQALIFLVFLIVLQQVEGNLIYPRVVGSSLKLPAIWVLAAVTVGGSLLGVVGMVLSVPLAASFYRLVREDVNRVSPLTSPDP